MKWSYKFDQGFFIKTSDCFNKEVLVIAFYTKNLKGFTCIFK
jgi:hypothetical protein